MAPAPKPQETLASVLVVEDEVLIRLVIADELRAQGFLVVEAATADQALSYFQAGARIDLVLSDIEMPGSMNGAGLIQRLRFRSAESADRLDFRRRSRRSPSRCVCFEALRHETSDRSN